MKSSFSIKIRYVEQTHAWHASFLKMWTVYISKRQLALVPKTCLVYSTNSHFWSIKVAELISISNIIWELLALVTLSNIIWKVERSIYWIFRIFHSLISILRYIIEFECGNSNHFFTDYLDGLSISNYLDKSSSKHNWKVVVLVQNNKRSSMWKVH